MHIVLWDSLSAWWPEILLSIGGLKVIMWTVFFRRPGLPVAGAWGFLLAAAAALCVAPVPPPTAVFFGLITCDPFSLAFRWLVLGTLAVTLLLIGGTKELSSDVRGEGIGVLLLLGVGLMLMAEANHLLTAYLAMELVSLSSYLLVGFLRDARSSEAALKYLLFGALSSGVMLYGMSLLFGLTGVLDFPGLRAALGGIAGPMRACLYVATALMFAGLAYKISLVPFHMWTPDVYEGAPVAVTALLSVGPKAAGLALLARFMEILAPAWAALEPILVGLAIATMTLGNLAALTQTNVKRLLAYSTIAQVGYLLIGLIARSVDGREAMLLYLVAYLFMNLGAFACLAAVIDATGSESVEAFRGLSKRSPVLALTTAVFLLSLAGLPPLFGFVGKLLLFRTALEAAMPVLAIAAAINSAAALYYYVNLIRLMYFGPPAESAPLRPSPAIGLALAVCAALTLILGLFPGWLLSLLRAGTAANLL
jgi:NADH-quinone oxidoreductase subunit N